jgi:NADH dehydrogenase FAD-containing subunit
MTTHRILILGGGFGGVCAARRLDQIFAHSDDVEITLLSGENFLLFTPMLAEVVSSSIEASRSASDAWVELTGNLRKQENVSQRTQRRRIATKSLTWAAGIGLLASLGRRCAVAEICGFDFSGFFAWWLWRAIYLLKLPGLERKVRVALDWTLDLFFPRDIVLFTLLMRPSAAALTAKVNIEAETASSVPTF